MYSSGCSSDGGAGIYIWVQSIAPTIEGRPNFSRNPSLVDLRLNSKASLYTSKIAAVTCVTQRDTVLWSPLIQQPIEFCIEPVAKYRNTIHT